MKQCLKIKVCGAIQGVSYREFVQKHAQRFSIEGSVKNLDNHESVVIYACGASENLEKLIDFLYKGPPKSKVQDVQVEPLGQDKNFRNVFRIIGD